MRLDETIVTAVRRVVFRHYPLNDHRPVDGGANAVRARRPGATPLTITQVCVVTFGYTSNVNRGEALSGLTS